MSEQDMSQAGAIPAAAGSSDCEPPPMRWGYWLLRAGAQLLFTTLFRGRVFGLRHVPRRGGAILVSNHQSFLDPILATLAIPRECHYMARDTLFHHPQFGRFITYLNAFPVKRGSADIGAIKETLRRLRANQVVLTFPEGTRSIDGSIGPMRAGVVLLARKTRVPIVPTLILGALECWPRTRKLPRCRPLLVAYGPPVYPHLHPEWEDDACLEHVRAQVLDLHRRYSAHSMFKPHRRSVDNQSTNCRTGSRPGS